MEWLLILIMLVGIMVYTKRSKQGGQKSKSSSAYKMKVKKLLREPKDDLVEENQAEIFDTIYQMAGEPGIQEFFRKTYGKMCRFSPEERVLESYFLLVFGDMRTHHLYRYSEESGGFKPEYEEYYQGNKNYNMIVTDKCLYFGDDLDQKKRIAPVRVPLYKVEQVELTHDYVEITVATRLSGSRVHNVWCSSGNGALYRMLSHVLEHWEKVDGREPIWTSNNGRNILK